MARIGEERAITLTEGGKSFHGKFDSVHHNHSFCSDGRDVDGLVVVIGTGGKPLCPACAKLKAEEGTLAIQNVEAERIHASEQSANGKLTAAGVALCLLGPIIPPIGLLGIGVFATGLFRLIHRDSNGPLRHRNRY